MKSHLSNGLIVLSVLVLLTSLFYNPVPSLIAGSVLGALGFGIFRYNLVYKEEEIERTELHELRDQLEVERAKVILEDLKIQAVQNQAKRDILKSRAGKETGFMF